MAVERVGPLLEADGTGNSRGLNPGGDPEVLRSFLLEFDISDSCSGAEIKSVLISLLTDRTSPR